MTAVLFTVVYIALYRMWAKICKPIAPERVIPAVYDCEPLLSPEEEESLA